MAGTDERGPDCLDARLASRRRISGGEGKRNGGSSCWKKIYNARMRVAFTKERLASRVRQLGRAISKDYAGRTLDVLVVLDIGFLFGADLIRCISVPIVCRFLRAEMRDISLAGHDRREIYFSWPPGLRGRDVLLVDAAPHGHYTGLPDEADFGEPA